MNKDVVYDRNSILKFVEEFWGDYNLSQPRSFILKVSLFREIFE